MILSETILLLNFSHKTLLCYWKYKQFCTLIIKNGSILSIANEKTYYVPINKILRTSKLEKQWSINDQWI